MLFSSLVSNSLFALTACSTATASRIPLSKRNLHRRDASAVGAISSSGGFWFGDFAVGGSSSLNMLIDTGSGDVIVNAGLYKPSSTSKSINATFDNTYATTSSDGTGTGDVVGILYMDRVSFGTLSATQMVGEATGAAMIPSDGIVGFAGKMFWQFPDNSTSFMQTLCTQGKVSECRFGLALANENNGSLIMGQLDTDMYTGDLAVGPIYQTGWATKMDLAVNGTIVTRDISVELDSGTATILGPIEDVSSIFEANGIKGVLSNSSSGLQLTGYFPCDSPPNIGFSFPSQTNASTAVGTISKNSTIFDIPANTWAAVDNGNNNCTAILGGQDVAAFPGLWVVGQPFFQGRYLDHNLAESTIGIATLKTSSNATTTVSPTSSPTPEATTTTSGATPRGGIQRGALFGLPLMVAFCML
ncbi:acid protease [Mollisia scopiformis]|uniref:Acid protease n=1 Tax=Mollisia scopiformis TaxID=149040 RepID=A0A194XAW7_MOLSC|nr:acid protease [Mollisia scopiformis]KUJ16902.1 acid protease [Mollisia scopiformis]